MNRTDLCLAVIMDAADVPVRHAARQLDFREEALRHRGVVERLLPQDLDGDRFVQRSIVRLVHDTHPAFADVLEDLVAIGEDGARPGGESGGCRVYLRGRRQLVVCHCPTVVKTRSGPSAETER